MLSDSVFPLSVRIFIINSLCQQWPLCIWGIFQLFYHCGILDCVRDLR